MLALPSLTAVEVDVTQHQATTTLTTEGPDEVGAIAMRITGNSFTDAHKVVLSPTSPLALLYATTLTTIGIHIMPDPINPWFLRICHVPKPKTKEGEILPPKPVPHTQAALGQPYRYGHRPSRRQRLDHHRSTTPPPKTPTRHNHITKRHKTSFASVTMNAHKTATSKLPPAYLHTSTHLDSVNPMSCNARRCKYSVPTTDPLDINRSSLLVLL
jgi:hypothetical protein